MQKELICITCPIGCHLTVELDNNNDVVNVTGNQCNRGVVYAKNELTNPKRMLTSSVKIVGAIHPMLPVITSEAIPKPKIFDCMEEINKVEVKAPVKMGDVVLENVCGTGVNIIASRSMKEID